MLDLKFLRKNADKVAAALAARRSDIDMGEFARLDEKRRELLSEVEGLKAERNKGAAEVGKIKKAGGDAGELIARMNEVNERIKAIDASAKAIDEEVRDFQLSVPNIPHESVPDGGGEEDNPVVRTWGRPACFTFKPKNHWEIGPALGGLDFERAAKLAGARFAVYWDWAARLERALISFMLDVQTREHGYMEVMPPVIVNSAAMTGTGQLPKFAADLFKLEGCDYYLIPTAEVPVTNLHAGEVLNESELPRRYASYTPCFRSEAGSYGKDTKGLIRLHQFNKVELVRFEKPENSYAALEELTGHAEEILRRLNLPYRVIQLCTGDLGFSSAKTYDLEVWLPGQQAYREISSCSNFEDFQARRADIRYKPAGGKSAFVHTLNGSGLAVGRCLVAVIENYQRADGSIEIPEALRGYMGGTEIIGPAAK